MGKRTYSDTEKATALAMLDANSGNLSRTQRETSVPRSTLREWRDGRHHDDVADLRQEKKADLADLLEEKVLAMLGGITADKIRETGIKDLWTGIGIGTDKILALRGQQQPGARQANVFLQMNGREADGGLWDHINRISEEHAQRNGRQLN